MQKFFTKHFKATIAGALVFALFSFVVFIMDFNDKQSIDTLKLGFCIFLGIVYLFNAIKNIIPLQKKERAAHIWIGLTIANLIIALLPDFRNYYYLSWLSFFVLLFWSSLLIYHQIKQSTPTPKPLRLERFLEKRQWIAWLAVLIIMGIAFFIRAYGLSPLDTTFDERFAIYGAKYTLEDKIVNYNRSPLVIELAARAADWGNAVSYDDYKYWARFPFTVLGAITVIFVFLLGKRVSILTGLTASILWAVSPWSIGMSRIAREYALYLPLILIAVWLCIQLLESFAQLRKKWLPFVLSLVALAFCLYQFAFYDKLSTIKLGALFVGITGFSWLLVYYKKLANWQKILIVLIAVVGVFFVAQNVNLYLLRKNFLQHISYQWLFYYLKPMRTQAMWWFVSNINSMLVLVLLLMAMVMALIYKNKNALLFFLIFGFVLAIFVPFFPFFPQMRYIYYLLPIFSILIAYVPVSFLQYVHQKVSFRGYRTAVSIGVAVVFLFIFNYNSLARVLITYDKKNSRVFMHTGELYFKKENISAFIKNVIKQGTANKDGFVISSEYLDVAKILIPNARVRYFTKNTTFESVESAMRNTYHGWIILPKRITKIDEFGFPQMDNFRVYGKTVALVKEDEDLAYYEWRNEDVLTDLEVPLFYPKTSNKKVTNNKEKILFDPQVKLDLTKPFSIAFWYVAYQETPGSPISLGNYLDRGISLESRQDFGLGGLYFHYDVQEGGGVSTGYINDATFHHLVFYQKDGTSGSEYGVYVDGKVINYNYIITSKQTQTDFKLLKFFGDTQDMRIYDKALTPEQVAAIYNNGEITTEVFLIDANGQKFGPIHHFVKK
ncbi:MAG: hypothetical protein KDD49_02000 [Bacteroidetes bacterium]|nr:hypothetical protein [Bacteroidota bacterium]MCB9043872.1 hypothetical protein [Chitinophagales bacterium]